MPGVGGSLPSRLPSAAGIYRLVQGAASFLPFPTWASAHSPSLGDEFSNKLEPRGANKWPSQAWPAVSSKYFPSALGEIFIRVPLGLVCQPARPLRPTCCGAEREGLSAVPGNWGLLWTWDSFLREHVWSTSRPTELWQNGEGLKKGHRLVGTSC